MPTGIEKKCPDCGADSPPIKKWKYKNGGHSFRQQCQCGWKSSSIATPLAIQINKSEKFEQFDEKLNDCYMKSNHSHPLKTSQLEHANITYANQATFENL